MLNRFFGVLALLCAAPFAWSAPLAYQGELTLCLTVCDSFQSFGAPAGGSQNPVASVVNVTIDIPIEPDGSFNLDATTPVPFVITIENPSIPLELPIFYVPGVTEDCPPPRQPGQVCNAGTVNPTLFTPDQAELVGSSGVIDPATGLPVSGHLRLDTLVPPYGNNSLDLDFDLADNTVTGSVFGGALIFLQGEGNWFNPDPDGDGFAASQDNCLDAFNPNQRDTDADGIGNRCDADLNNDCIVNVVDLGIMRGLFFTADANADLNGDGVVNVSDLGILRAGFFSEPGPSGLPNVCAGP